MFRVQLSSAQPATCTPPPPQAPGGPEARFRFSRHSQLTGHDILVRCKPLCSTLLCPSLHLDCPVRAQHSLVWTRNSSDPALVLPTCIEGSECRDRMLDRSAQPTALKNEDAEAHADKSATDA